MGRRMMRAPPVSTTRPVDPRMADPATCGCECVPAAGLDACTPPIRTWPGIETAARLAAVGLQIFAPKRALCWTTYAGLFNAGWFVATNIHPVWASLAALSSTLAMCISLLAARRTRRYRAWLWMAASWPFLIAGWLLDCLSVRWLGFGLLAASFAYAGLPAECAPAGQRGRCPVRWKRRRRDPVSSMPTDANQPLRRRGAPR
jgi:hypothetical protein